MDTGFREQLAHYCRQTLSLLTAAVLLTLVCTGHVHAERTVVLIAAKGSEIGEISNRDVRRIFLGLKSADSDAVRKPVLNMYDRDVYEEFLKNVMHMTDGAYRRKIVKRIFRHGTEEIREIARLDELAGHLTAHVGDISFVDYNSIEKMKDIEVVKVLW